jgi:hypothetical protein
MKGKSNAQLYLSPASYTPADATNQQAVTSITAAKPAIVTATNTITDLADGDLALFAGTGASDLDGKAWRVAAVDTVAKTFELVESDRTGATAVGAAGTFEPYGDGNLIHACEANVTVTGQAPDSISLDDMCGTMTVLGDAKPDTFSFTGWVDNADAGFRNLIRASKENPKTKRVLLIDYGPDVGYVIGPAEIGETTVTAAVGAGLQYSGSGVFTAPPTFSWALGPEPVAA